MHIIRKGRDIFGGAKWREKQKSVGKVNAKLKPTCEKKNKENKETAVKIQGISN